ncbi:MAG: ATP-dependent helicase HrpB [Lysobacterales bacterium]|nr:MAG: ATP-dependent helicase HrpB [Xanthomonadales bacterium]
MNALPTLPITGVLPDLEAALAAGRAVVLEAPPGAGKSTLVPLKLLEAAWRGDARIVMLEPRRIAARAVAERMASLLGERAGGRVGYRTRLETRVGPTTRLEIVTEGILTRMLQHDPALEGVACLVFDEFHERNLQGDLGLALALECRRHLRPDLRFVVMSATLDGDALARHLGDATVVRSLGRTYDVETRYAPQLPPGNAPRPIADWVAGAIARAIEEHPGDVLAFLPGAGEIRRVAAALAGSLDARRYAVLPLYGDLPAGAQDAVLAPDPAGRRKIVVATNLAETSLTIDGVRVVVDAGLERRNRFDPTSGMSRLETVRISRASADQRRGRAGRTATGVCHRLWSESAHAALLPQAPPEILEADLAPLALELACWGTTDATTLTWLDPPPAATLAQARDLLLRLEALGPDDRVTPLGRDMAAIGLHPRLAHMVLRAGGLGYSRLACELAALLSERDPVRASGGGAPDPDLRLRLDALHGQSPGPALTADRGALQRIDRLRQQVEQQVRRVARGDGQRGVSPGAAGGGSLDESEAVGLLLAFAYPDRIGRRRAGESGRYALSGGRGAAFAGPAAIARSEFIVVAALDAGDREARIQLAAPLDPALLEQHFGAHVETVDVVEWDPRSESVAARRLRRLGQLVLADEALRGPNPRAFEALLEGLRALGLRVLPWTRDLEQWRDRVAFARASDPGGAWPDVSDEALLADAARWLGPYLEGVTRREHFARVDLRAALHGLLDWAMQQKLDRHAPTHLAVPSGSRIAIDYSGGTPRLAVRLQEVFGLGESPRVAGGRVSVTLELLSPARRPVQVTQDLASFWARGYHEVRRELKGRYPRHYWPDDPHEAVATRRARPPPG